MNISTKNIFLIFLGFQLTWLFCVFGEYYNYPLLGLFVGIIYLFIYFFFTNHKLKALKTCFVFSLIGYSFDTILGYSNIFIINSKITFGYLPIWFLVLWPSFTTLLVDILVFLKHRPLIALLMGSFIAPPTYYLGIPIGIAICENLLLAMITMMIFWGLYLTFYSFYLKKNYSI